jgi:hypothetical protein
MAHSFIMFFLIATGVELKEMEKQGWGTLVPAGALAFRSRVFPS